MQILNTNKPLIGQLAIVSIALTLPLSLTLGNIAVIMSFALSLLFIKKEVVKVNYPFPIYFPFLFFVIVFISAIFSKNMDIGFSRLDRHLLPLLLTGIFVVFKEISLNRVLKLFTYFLTFYTSILIGKLILGLIKGQGLDQLVFHDFTALYGQHPVYYGLQILVSLLYLISKLKDDYAVTVKDWRWYIQIIILQTGMIFCASKAVIFIFIFLLLSGLAIYVKGKKSLLLALTFLCIFILCIFKFEYLKNRFLEGTSVKYEILEFKPSNDFTLKKQFSFEEKQEITDLELRILMGKITLYHMCLDGAMGFGYGSGDAQDYLDYYLFSYNLGPNWYQGYNVHNQYLHLLLNYGIVVLSLFLVYLFMLFRYAFKEKDYLHMAILIAFCFVFLFEVSLIRNKGIVLFYFFNLLFLTNNTHFENSYFRNTGNT